MNFEESLRQLYSLVDYEKQPTDKYRETDYNLEGFRELIRRLGNPQEHFRSIHVTGSDAKGTVCEMLGKVLEAAGARVGVYTSPHVACVTERIVVCGASIPKEDFSRLLERVYPVATSEEVLGTGPNQRGYATVFEILTAIAWLFFQEREVEWAVVEVGLGGRLDATNILNPAACVITPICLEHTERLGKTLADIAREKAGIIKREVPVVLSEQVPSLRAQLIRAARDKQAPVLVASEEFSIHVNEMTPDGTCFQMRSQDGEEINVALPAVGVHQTANAAVVATLAREIWGVAGFSIPWQEALVQGLARFRSFCRCEVVALNADKTLYAVLDRGHTPQACQALRETLDVLWPDSRRVFVLGCLRGKDPAAMTRVLLRQRDRIIATTPSDNPRAMPADALAQCLPPRSPVVEKPSDAFRLAREMTEGEGIIVVTGSAYMLDEVRRTCHDNG